MSVCLCVNCCMCLRGVLVIYCVMVFDVVCVWGWRCSACV